MFSSGISNLSDIREGAVKKTWERVQELRKQRKRPTRYDEVGLFSVLLFCADCGSYKKRTKDCTAHFIRTDLLTAGVIQNLRKVTSYAANHEARFVKLITSQNEAGSKRKAAAMKKSMEEIQSRIADLNKIIKRLYKDNVLGKITDTRFMELSQDYEAEDTGSGRKRRLIFITDLSARLTCRKNSPPYPALSSPPDRNGKIFYTSFTSLSHISKKAGR